MFCLLQWMVCSPPGLTGVRVAGAAEEANEREHDHVVTLVQANVENLALVKLKRVWTVTLILARVRVGKAALTKLGHTPGEYPGFPIM